MTKKCCDDNPINDVYVPLYNRLLDYGKEVFAETLLHYPNTHIWIFTFYKEADMCTDCETKFTQMAQWFVKYGLFQNATKNIKWVVDDDVENNLILKDLNIDKTPMHLFCDKDGKVFDVVFGFPEVDWLERFILPLVKEKL